MELRKLTFSESPCSFLNNIDKMISIHDYQIPTYVKYNFISINIQTEKFLTEKFSLIRLKSVDE